MDYEQKYKEALERAKAIYYQGSYKPDTAATIAETLQNVFPELKESEGESIRKSIIGFLIAISSLKDGKTLSNEDFDSKAILEWVAWLEKQGEQKNPWSKEDEMMLQFAIAHFECQKRNCIEGGSRRKVMQEYINWLKSLRFKTIWKPSIAQLNAISIVSKGNAPDDIEAIMSLYNDLEKLREE